MSGIDVSGTEAGEGTPADPFDCAIAAGTGMGMTSAGPAIWTTPCGYTCGGAMMMYCERTAAKNSW